MTYYEPYPCDLCGKVSESEKDCCREFDCPERPSHSVEIFETDPILPEHVS